MLKDAADEFCSPLKVGWSAVTGRAVRARGTGWLVGHDAMRDAKVEKVGLAC